MRLWRGRAPGQELEVAGGPDPGWRVSPPGGDGPIATPGGSAFWGRIPVDGGTGWWLELQGAPDPEAGARSILPVLAEIVGKHEEAIRLAEEVQDRSAEIELLYVISEILGRVLDPREAAQKLLQEVSDRLQARRASLMVHDPEAKVLRTYAARGYPAEAFAPVSALAEHPISARAFREERVIAYDPAVDGAESPGDPAGRTYVGRAFLSVPIRYAVPGAPGRCVGVINFTDRIGNDAFTAAEQRLVRAVASQIGAAIENTRLVFQERRRERVHRELELAHDLQLKLLPSPAVLLGDAKVAARCRPAESVGGDFYTFVRLGRGRVGVMLGDVSSHGFSAALIQAMVVAAAGIHAAASNSPDETLAALLESIGPELSRADMYLSAFYAVLDPERERLDYSNAGHPYAWRITAGGAAERLGATSPPLGLAPVDGVRMKTLHWEDDDLLVLLTDGLVEGRNATGEAWGDERLLQVVLAHRREPVERVVEAVFAEADRWSGRVGDDRTLLVMRL